MTLQPLLTLRESESPHGIAEAFTTWTARKQAEDTCGDDATGRALATARARIGRHTLC